MNVAGHDEHHFVRAGPDIRVPARWMWDSADRVSRCSYSKRAGRLKCLVHELFEACGKYITPAILCNPFEVHEVRLAVSLAPAPMLYWPDWMYLSVLKSGGETRPFILLSGLKSLSGLHLLKQLRGRSGWVGGQEALGALQPERLRYQFCLRKRQIINQTFILEVPSSSPSLELLSLPFPCLSFSFPLFCFAS